MSMRSGFGASMMFRCGVDAHMTCHYNVNARWSAGHGVNEECIAGKGVQKPFHAKWFAALAFMCGIHAAASADFVLYGLLAWCPCGWIAVWSRVDV